MEGKKQEEAELVRRKHSGSTKFACENIMSLCNTSTSTYDQDGKKKHFNDNNAFK